MISFRKILGFIFFLGVLLILYVFGFFHILSVGLEKVGLSAQGASIVLALAVVGSFINIPLGKKNILVVEEPYFFGFFKRRYAIMQGISINAGGALVPMALSLYFLFTMKDNFFPVFFATLCVAVVSKIFAKYIPGRGVALSPFLVAFFAVAIAFIFDPYHAAQVAFISGTLGVLLGADLLNLPKILGKKEAGVLSIGGAGVFDGIFFIGIVSALIAGL